MEKPEENLHAKNLIVIKRNHSQQPLNTEKINKILTLAFAQKTTPKITSKTTETICQSLQTHAQQNKTTTISSSVVATHIATQLRKQNFAAYLRFISAQQNLNAIEEIQELIASEKATQTHQKK